jgi:Rieske 2Fe-2S family protein
MIFMNGPTSDHVQRYLQMYRPGHSLPRPFYQDELIYQAELAQIWRRGWLFAGYTNQIPNPGDFFLYSIDTESIIILRNEQNDVVAFRNLCTHRGSILVEKAGHCRTLVCPYHQWSFGLDGRLRQCRSMTDQFDKTPWGLHAVAVRAVAGLIYISLDDHPPDFDRAEANLREPVEIQGFEQAKIAHVFDYQIQANWKLVWENNRECYHCESNHPEYLTANFDRYDTQTFTPKVAEQFQVALKRHKKALTASGVSGATTGLFTESGLFAFPDAEKQIWYTAYRTALVADYITQSLNGQPIAPLMGAYQHPDVGTLRARTLPNFWFHASSDHAVSTRLTPAGLHCTHAQVVWLVNADAEPGKDYQLEDLLPFWQLTSEQDWLICERQQQGVNSLAYTSGPLSPLKEANVDQFLQWYVKQLSQAQ